LLATKIRVFLEHFCWSEKVRVFGKKRGHFKFCGHFKCTPFILCGPGIMYYPHGALAEYRQSKNGKLAACVRKKYAAKAAVIVSNAETAQRRSRSATEMVLNFSSHADSSSSSPDLYESDDSDDDNDSDIKGDSHSIDNNPDFRQKFKNVDFETVSKNTSRRYYSYGMFSQRENTSLESIRYLEYLNWDPARKYQGRIRHAYNSNEKKIGRYCVDGYVEWEDEFVPGSGMTVTRKEVIEFNGCTFHACPWCRRKPWKALKKFEYCHKEKKRILKEITIDELRRRDEARMHEISDALRADDPPDPSDPPTPGHFGPRNFHHKIKIKWACRWLKDWHMLETGVDYDRFIAAESRDRELMPPPPYLPGTVFKTPPRPSPPCLGSASRHSRSAAPAPPPSLDQQPPSLPYGCAKPSSSTWARKTTIINLSRHS